MTPLRKRFIEDMQLRGLAPTTQRAYIHYVAEFALYFGKSPEVLDLEAVRQYQLHLLNDRKLSPESINQYLSAVKFLYLQTLEMPWTDEYFPRVMVPRRLPIVLSQEELMTFFDHIPGLKYRAALMTCYGAGLRISETVALKVTDIDSGRMLIRVEQGKGQKDRYAMLSPRLLEVLRRYWRAFRPNPWLFSSWRPIHHLSTTSLQMACREAALRAGIRKRVTVHTLRHYAGFRTIPGEGSLCGRKARQCRGEARPLVESPGIVLVIDFGGRRVVCPPGGSGRACRRAALFLPESPPSLQG